jgi:uncharacterized protein (DUF2164 family)
VNKIKLSKSQRQAVAEKLARYFEQELDYSIGQFDCEFLLDFISDELGPYYYNQGLLDAQAVIASRMEDIIDSIDEIERPIKN